MTERHVMSVNRSLAQPLTINGRSVMTAIGKRSVTGAITIGPLGLAGDEQADLSVHGGLSKAVYAYPSEHYPFWQSARAQARVCLWDEPLAPGTFGENFTLCGVLESEVFVGDILRFPDCALCVSEPRYPCFKFNAVMGFALATSLMATQACCGFYLSVLEPGQVQSGEQFELIHGPRQARITEIFRSRMSARKR